MSIYRHAATSAGLPIIPGTDTAIDTAEVIYDFFLHYWTFELIHLLTNLKEAVAFCQAHGVPVMFKAAFGGGGRGMRVVMKMEEVAEQFERARSVKRWKSLKW